MLSSRLVFIRTVNVAFVSNRARAEGLVITWICTNVQLTENIIYIRLVQKCFEEKKTILLQSNVDHIIY